MPRVKTDLQEISLTLYSHYVVLYMSKQMYQHLCSCYIEETHGYVLKKLLIKSYILLIKLEID